MYLSYNVMRDLTQRSLSGASLRVEAKEVSRDDFYGLVMKCSSAVGICEVGTGGTDKMF
jgi:hypothetical protein